jgi:hypothetical protein
MTAALIILAVFAVMILIAWMGAHALLDWIERGMGR